MSREERCICDKGSCIREKPLRRRALRKVSRRKRVVSVRRRAIACTLYEKERCICEKEMYLWEGVLICE
jgi:hypothetical protein